MSKPAASSWRDARRRDASAILVSTAWEIVREVGLGGLSLRDLARRAGITTPTVYAYFESKNAIYDAMFKEAAESFAESMAKPIEAGDPHSTLAIDAKRFVDFCTSDVPRYQLLFQHLLPGFVPSKSPTRRRCEPSNRPGKGWPRTAYAIPRMGYLDRGDDRPGGPADRQRPRG